MTLSLPTTDDVDGGMLSDFANHSAILIADDAARDDHFKILLGAH